MTRERRLPDTALRRRRSRRGTWRALSSHGAVAGPLAGLVGAAVVDGSGRVAERFGVERRPTLPALLVAKAVRRPDVSSRRRGPTRRTLSALLGVERASGTDADQSERVGTAAHYLWGIGWGGFRVALDGSSGNLSSALTHFVMFTAADHTLLALANVGTPVWAPSDGSDDHAHKAVHQLAQLILYVTVTNVVYARLRRQH